MLTLVDPTTEAGFLPIFNRLAVALREREDNTGVTQEIYFGALRDLPLRSLEEGAVALMREPGRKWFPTTAEWRQAALAVQDAAIRKALPSGRSEPWHVECGDCDDTGWEFGLACDGGETCGRKNPHAAHTFTRPCWCRPTNRTYQRHLESHRAAARAKQ